MKRLRETVQYSPKPMCPKCENTGIIVTDGGRRYMSTEFEKCDCEAAQAAKRA